ncbi:LIM domain kinase 1a isoform X3 [Tachysurus ichikawai]
MEHSVRCCECSASLSHWYYEKDGRLFCSKDYWAKFGELCHGCSEPITTGLIMGIGWGEETLRRSTWASSAGSDEVTEREGWWKREGERKQNESNVTCFQR